MKLIGQDDKSFELCVVDYQFRDNKHDEYDSNWLRIVIKLKGFKSEWITSDPSLLTWELKSLSDWLQNILTGDTEEKEIEFIEPNLKFELVDSDGDKFKVRVHLTLESKPVWHTEDETFSFDLVVDHGQLEHSVERLNNELITFPGRAGVKLN
jgi:hypothetical protein